jgi:hypothetical protein
MLSKRDLPPHRHLLVYFHIAESIGHLNVWLFWSYNKLVCLNILDNNEQLAITTGKPAASVTILARLPEYEMFTVHDHCLLKKNLRSENSRIVKSRPWIFKKESEKKWMLAVLIIRVSVNSASPITCRQSGKIIQVSPSAAEKLLLRKAYTQSRLICCVLIDPAHSSN